MNARCCSLPWSRILKSPGSRILDPGSRIISRIMDPGARIQIPGSRILDPLEMSSLYIVHNISNAIHSSEPCMYPIEFDAFAFSRPPFLVKVICTLYVLWNGSNQCSIWAPWPNLAWDPFGPIGPIGRGTHLGPWAWLGPALIWAHLPNSIGPGTHIFTFSEWPGLFLSSITI